LALRADLQRLFDAGLITVDDDYHLMISNHLKSKEYATYNGREVIVPDEDLRKPSRKALEVHRAIVFRD
jgi:hypothetical protein